MPTGSPESILVKLNRVGATNMRSLLIIALVTLTGCASVKDMMPSFWDDNQSSVIIDIRMHARLIDCEADHVPQVKKLQERIEWFELYSEAKGNKDMIRLIEPIKGTVKDFAVRAKEKQSTKTFCELKKKILDLQTEKAARVIHGRY